MGLRHLAAGAVGAFVLTGALTMNAAAQGRYEGDWVELGCQKVGFQTDRDTIRVGRREGRFTAIRLFSRGGDVEMINLRVIYTNGQPDDLPVRNVLERGERTRPIDLKGWERSIDRIDMVYRSIPNRRDREATVCVEGLTARNLPPPGPGPAAWVELGCKEVSFLGRDRDTLPIGRQEGRFRAIRLHVHGTDVKLRSLVVVYGRGDPDRLPAQHFIRAGEYTPPIDLKGFERSIREVEMVYESIPNFRRTARVCVQGLQS